MLRLTKRMITKSRNTGKYIINDLLVYITYIAIQDKIILSMFSNFMIDLFLYIYTKYTYIFTFKENSHTNLTTLTKVVCLEDSKGGLLHQRTCDNSISLPIHILLSLSSFCHSLGFGTQNLYISCIDQPQSAFCSFCSFYGGATDAFKFLGGIFSPPQSVPQSGPCNMEILNRRSILYPTWDDISSFAQPSESSVHVVSSEGTCCDIYEFQCKALNRFFFPFD